MKNAEIIRRSLDSVWHPCTQMKQHETVPLVPIARGKGVWLYDFEGNAYLDAVSSWWVNLFGHCNEKINAAIRDQMEKLEHVMLAGFTHEPAVELSQRLAQLSPGNLGHCFYASDGASAVEIALKMSFHYWKNSGLPEKSSFVSLQNGYHGETLGALSVTDISLFKKTYSPLLMRNFKIRSPDWRLAEKGESPESYALRCAGELDTFLETAHAKIAAFIVEPLVQGACGMGMHHRTYLREARKICDRHQVHLICDEIAVGFGRTGTFFASEQAGISPDFLCLSKGITGGYLPLSAVLTTDAIYRSFYSDSVEKGFLHSHSYTGSALACRAALAVLDIFAEEDILQKNAVKADYFNKNSELALHPKVRNFRNTGMIWAFEVDAAAEDFSGKFYPAALNKGLLLRPIGNTVYFMPPYVIAESEMDFLWQKTLEILDSLR